MSEPNLPPPPNTTSTKEPTTNSAPATTVKSIAKAILPPIKTSNKPSTMTPTAAINRQIQNYLMLGFIAITILVITTLILTILTGSKTKQLSLLKDQIAAKAQTDQELAGVAEYMRQRDGELTTIVNTLPDENLLIDFISTVENLATATDPNSSLEFSALAPASFGQDKALPFVIDLHTNLASFQDFLIRLEKLPYLIQVTSIQAKAEGETWQFTVSARVFVADPFKT